MEKRNSVGFTSVNLSTVQINKLQEMMDYDSDKNFYCGVKNRGLYLLALINEIDFFHENLKDYLVPRLTTFDSEGSEKILLSRELNEKLIYLSKACALRKASMVRASVDYAYNSYKKYENMFLVNFRCFPAGKKIILVDEIEDIPCFSEMFENNICGNQVLVLTYEKIFPKNKNRLIRPSDFYSPYSVDEFTNIIKILQTSRVEQVIINNASDILTSRQMKKILEIIDIAGIHSVLLIFESLKKVIAFYPQLYNNENFYKIVNSKEPPLSVMDIVKNSFL